MPTSTEDPPAGNRWLDTLYDRLAGDNDGRVCAEISDEACRETPGNFLRELFAHTLTTIGDKIASAKTTLPWLLASLGAPAWCLSLLVPIRESGSMLPQMAIGSVVRRMPIRKWTWVAGSVGQGISLALMAWAAWTLKGLPAGLVILGLLVVFSLCRGAASVAHKDVIGKTIPKTRRGRLSGWGGSISGLFGMLVGGGMALLSDSENPLIYIGLLLGGTLLWIVAAVIFSTIVEFPGETEGGRNGLQEGLAKLALLRDDVPFRRFVIARALAMGSGLAAPFYVTLARDDLGSAARYLGIFIAVEGLAGLLSAPIWGYWADHSSRKVFATACGLAGILSLLVAAGSWLGWAEPIAWWFYPLAFFGLGISHAGVRLGRKTYLVDMAEGNRRTDYVAVSNTVIGGLLLVSGLIGALAAMLSIEAAIAILAIAGLAGSVMGWRWKEVSGGS